MRKTGFALALAAMLVVPTVGSAEPTKADTKAASAECHSLVEATAGKANLETLGFENFGDCVSQKAREEAAERKAARRAAREACADVKGKAHSDCVSAKAKAKKAKKDSKDAARIEAAGTCTAEQEDADAFAEKYGTKKSAYRKCVQESMHAPEADES